MDDDPSGRDDSLEYKASAGVNSKSLLDDGRTNTA
jgi:hypothetical protein